MRISYILPTYNVKDYIRECIESLYAQNLRETDFEVIVVIDGSTDNSLEIVRSIQFQHNNIVILEQENQGVSVARNNGLRMAKGNYVLFVDPDDALVPGTIDPIIRELELSEADVFVGEVNGINIKEWPATYENLCCRSDRKLSCKKFSGESYFSDIFNVRKGYCFIYVSRRVYLLEQRIEFPAGIVFTEDTWFSFNLILHAGSVLYSDYVYYAYRNYHGSAVSMMSVEKIRSMFWVAEHIYHMRLDPMFCHRDLSVKIRNCSYVIFNLAIWYLSHYESVYKERNSLLKSLSFKPVYVDSMKRLGLSLWFYVNPCSLIYVKHGLSKKIYRKWW